ncbi:MAG: hypothetical protein WDA71_00865 [Actinomycetota bacterium]
MLSRLGRALRRDEGLTILEVAIAGFILAVGILAVAGSLGLGLRLLGDARQRTGASGMAQKYLEYARNLPYSAIGLTSMPTHSTDPKSPDYYVSDTPVASYNAGGGAEPLIVGGQIDHTTTVAQANSTMEIYQYVTWVSSSKGTPGGSGTAEAAKRVTVVARWARPQVGGTSDYAKLSSIFTPGVVSFPPASFAPTQVPTLTPTATASPSPTPSGSPTVCLDENPPAAPTNTSIAFAITTGFAKSADVTLHLGATDACPVIEVQFSDNGTDWKAWQAYSPSVIYTLSGSDGQKTVYARYRDGAWRESGIVQASIVLDRQAPTAPGSLNWNKQSKTLAWSASSDTYLSGYRVYRRASGITDWGSPIGSNPSTATSYYDAGAGSGYYDFMVEAYDKAGNTTTAVILNQKGQD